jgi:predicted transcriptional regulator
MKAKFEIHPIQAHILRTLTFHPQARFSQINEFKLPTDQFTFHINSLVQTKLIEKIEQGLYQLTLKGKEFANRFDTDKVTIEKQAKISVLIGCVKESGNQKQFLVQQRLKQPYYGYFGFVSGF